VLRDAIVKGKIVRVESNLILSPKEGSWQEQQGTGWRMFPSQCIIMCVVFNPILTNQVKRCVAFSVQRPTHKIPSLIIFEV